MQFEKYISHFFSQKCAHDLLPFFIGCKRRAGKEVTESFGMFHACDDIDLNDCIVISHGDGKLPRTGAVFAFMSRAEVHSVDPELDLNWFEVELPKHFGGLRPRRMTLHKDYGHKVKIDCQGKHCILIGTHSHCHLKDAVTIPFNYSKLTVIQCPCCVNIPDKFLTRYFTERTGFNYYKDSNIWSPKNEIYIWKDFNLEYLKPKK